nr:ATP-grasp domain-containing protein [uncultured Sphingomonas sp.]
MLHLNASTLDRHGSRRRLQHHLTILITSAGRRAGLIEAFRRGGAELGIDLEVLACDKQPLLSAACHLADGAYPVPEATAPGYVDALLAIVRDRKVALVVPTIDPELLPLARARERFEQAGARVAISAPDVVGMARDKLATAQFLDRCGVANPRTATLDEVRENPGDWTWPAIVKPRHGSASRAILIARGPDELPRDEAEPMIVQALLTGDEWTVNMYFDDAGRLRAVVPHRRISVRAGEVEKGVTRRAPRLIEAAEAMAAQLPDASGVLCYQAMINPDATASVFEINARFGGGFPLADHAGAHFARWLLESRLGMPSTAGNDWAEGVMMLRYDAAVFVQS